MIYRSILLWLAIILITGCAIPKKMSRSRGYFKPVNPSGGAAVSHPYNSSNTFNGRLNLLYERKVRGATGSPIYIGESSLGYLTTKRRFIFLDQENGNLVCRVKKGKGYILNPIVTDSLIVLTRKLTLGQIRVRNFFTNKTIQTRTVKHIRSGPILSNNNLILGTVNGIMALSFPELKFKWEHKLGQLVNINPVSDGDIIYFTSGSGTVGALKADNGDMIWEKKLPASVISEISLGRYLYLGLSNNSLVALSKTDGIEVWSKQLEFPIQGKGFESGERLYIGADDGNVYCLSIYSGTTVWEFATDGIVTAQPVVYNNTVLVGSHDRFFYSINSESGDMLDKQLLEGPVSYAAAIHNNRIFVACRKNRLYCFEGN
ncbi:MAG: PQQ-binding-like beta-propeller repeat protein [candidate division Zixibacteria bacterium]|nr:PQQ-binding-like beta-propeller repeat protein [candidate division Zixibacteria bacterium]